MDGWHAVWDRVKTRAALTSPGDWLGGIALFGLLLAGLWMPELLWAIGGGR